MNLHFMPLKKSRGIDAGIDARNLSSSTYFLCLLLTLKSKGISLVKSEHKQYFSHLDYTTISRSLPLRVLLQAIKLASSFKQYFVASSSRLSK